MKPRYAISLFPVALLGFAPGALADGYSFARPAPQDSIIDPQIVGGTLSDVADWPATLVIRYGSKTVCTGTVIGPRVVLTAAHCVPNGTRACLFLKDTDERGDCEDHRKLRCEHHPKYTRYHSPVLTTSADWALCASGSDIEVELFETVSKTKPDALKPLHLTGFGCSKAGDTVDGYPLLFEGPADVVSLPNPADVERWRINYIQTKGGAAVCFADSGGGAFVHLDASKLTRALVGVNSRGELGRSYIAATKTDHFIEWVDDWLRRHALSACGLSPDVENCHE